MNPAHRQATCLLFGFAFLTAATYVVTRTFAITAFLARVGSDSLPICILTGAVTVMLFSWLNVKLLRYVNPFALAAITWLLMAAATYWLAVTIPRVGDSIWILTALYVFAEVRGCVNTIYLVTLINESFADSESKHPFAMVASGAPVAGIVVGTILGIEASIAALVPTLALMSVLDLFVSGLIWFSRHRLSAAGRMDSDQTNHRRLPEVGSGSQTGERRYRFQLSSLVGLKIIVLTLIGYQWKVAAGDYFGKDEERMVIYFALFYACSDVLIVLLQWLVSGKLLDRYGIGIGLIGFPCLLFAAGLASLVTDSVFTLMILFTVARGLHVVRRAIHDPALTAAYTVLRPGFRRETIMLVKGIIKPFSEAATALILIVIGANLTHVGTTGIWLILIPVWLIFSLRATRAFRQATIRVEPG